MRSPRPRATELRHAGHRGGSRPLPRVGGHRLRRSHRAQHRRRLLGPARRWLGLSKQLATVTGVEVTTYNPRSVTSAWFPIRSEAAARRSRERAPAASSRRGIAAIRAASCRSTIRASLRASATSTWSTSIRRSAGSPRECATDFDTLEVYNGYDLATRARTEQVLEDWFALLNLGKHIWATGSSDSHRNPVPVGGLPPHDGVRRPEGGRRHRQPRRAQPRGRGDQEGALVRGRAGPMIELESRRLGRQDGAPRRRRRRSAPGAAHG